MDELITKEEIEVLRCKANTVNFEDIINGSAALELVEIVELKSGYSVGLTYEYYPNFSIEHLSVRGIDELDAATFDCIACSVLGSEYVHIGSIYVEGVSHYLRLSSGDKEIFDDFVKFMKYSKIGGII